MKIKEIMTKDVVYVDKDVDLKYVLKLMKKHNITKIPVLENKKLIGVITDNIIAKNPYLKVLPMKTYVAALYTVKWIPWTKSITCAT